MLKERKKMMNYDYVMTVAHETHLQMHADNLLVK